MAAVPATRTTPTFPASNPNVSLLLSVAKFAIGVTRDKLFWVWYMVAMDIVSLLGTLAIRIPGEWTFRSTAGVPTGPAA